MKNIELEIDQVEDFPKSDVLHLPLIEDLCLRQKEFVGVAVFYDVTKEEKQTDAIAVFAEHRDESEAYTIYYPYKMVGNMPHFAKPWKSIAEKQIFVN